MKLTNIQTLFNVFQYGIDIIDIIYLIIIEI